MITKSWQKIMPDLYSLQAWFGSVGEFMSNCWSNVKDVYETDNNRWWKAVYICPLFKNVYIIEITLTIGSGCRYKPVLPMLCTVLIYTKCIIKSRKCTSNECAPKKIKRCLSVYAHRSLGFIFCVKCKWRLQRNRSKALWFVLVSVGTTVCLHLRTGQVPFEYPCFWAFATLYSRNWIILCAVLGSPQQSCCNAPRRTSVCVRTPT